LKNTGKNGKAASGFNMNSNENFKNLSAYFESENIPADEILWKEEDPFDYIAFIVSGRSK
jgi:CRP-like cAMP-binding protein